MYLILFINKTTVASPFR